MSYESGFFKNRRGKRLFYALEGDAGNPVWIFVGAALEEKIISHGVVRQFARRLVVEGFAVLRFDCEGEGDSEGESAEMGLAEWAQDTLDAASFLQERGVEKVSLFGCRLGAAAAAMAAAEISVGTLLLWCPITDGSDYMKELFRYNIVAQLSAFQKVVVSRDEMVQQLQTGGTVNVLGWEIGARLYESVDAFRLEGVLANCRCREKPLILTRTSSSAFWQEPRLLDYQQSTLTEASLEGLKASGHDG